MQFEILAKQSIQEGYNFELKRSFFLKLSFKLNNIQDTVTKILAQDLTIMST